MKLEYSRLSGGYNESELVPSAETRFLYVKEPACSARSLFTCTLDDEDDNDDESGVSLNIIYMTRRALCNQTSLTFHLIFHDDVLRTVRYAHSRRVCLRFQYVWLHANICNQRKEEKKKNIKCRSIGQI